MKQFIFISLLGISLIIESCKLDNFSSPDASVYGAIIDSLTGDTVQQNYGFSGNAVQLQVIQKGYSIEQPQSWKVMLNGAYRNNQVFSGTYDIVLNNGNFIPLDTLKNYKFKPGNNQLDFKVVPNIRIREPQIQKSDTSIVATFKLEFAHPEGKVQSIGLFVQSDQNTSADFYLVKITKDISDQNLNYGNRSSYENEEFKLELNLNSNEAKQLEKGRPYFFRIGAIPTGLRSNIQPQYNYSQVVEISL